MVRMQGLMSILPELFRPVPLCAYAGFLPVLAAHKVNLGRCISGTLLGRALTTEWRHIRTVSFQYQMFWFKHTAPLDEVFWHLDW